MVNQRRFWTSLFCSWIFLGFGVNSRADQTGHSWDRTILPREDVPFMGVANPTLLGSKPDWPKPVTAPSGAPNILLVLIDDAGFGNPSTFGGPIQTPNLDRLAKKGLRYNSFHVTALCSPTRAALLSGRNQHSVGFGSIAELSGGWPGYNSIWPRSAASIAKILQENGYSTAALGKWHLTPSQEQGPNGPFDRWPNHLGFDYFWGFLGAETDQYSPILFENQTVLGPPQDKDFYLNTAMADHAIRWLRNQKSGSGEKPFFLYFATGATHAPHQVSRSWSDHYRGQFDEGWERYREATFGRQKQLGLIPANTKLTPRDPAFPSWDSLPADQKQLYARQMEVFAGFQENTDYEVGRVIQEIERMGISDNTLIVTIWGDNGASMEGSETGTFNEMSILNGSGLTSNQQLGLIQKYGGLGAWGSPFTEPHYAAAWGWAGNTPFQWGKQVASHLGGTRDPMVISWPKRIRDVGGIRTQFTHVTDIAPTLLDVAGLPAPKKVDGVTQMPMHGVSFVQTFGDPKAKSLHRQQYFEVLGNRGMYQDGWWLACRMPRIPWEVDEKVIAQFAPGKFDPDRERCELYDLNTDFSQATDLSEKSPTQLAHLKSLWWEDAKKYQVLPILGGMASFFGLSQLDSDAQRLTYERGVENLLPGVAPHVFNRSWRVVADVVIPQGGAEGVIVSNGDYLGGYALYILDGKPRFTYSNLGIKTTTLSSSEKVPTGKVRVVYEFTADHPGLYGGGGKGELSVNSKKVAESRFESTVPFQFNISAGFDIGKNNGTPVVREGDYAKKVPFSFTGTIDKVVFELGPQAPARRQLSGQSGASQPKEDKK